MDFPKELDGLIERAKDAGTDLEEMVAGLMVAADGIQEEIDEGELP